MSIFPCDAHGRRVPGALQSYRVTLLSRSDRYTRRMRLCSEHFLAAISDLDKFVESIGDVDVPIEPVVCRPCGRKFVDGVHPFSAFAWAWPRKSDPIEFYGALCLDCGRQLIKDLDLELEVDGVVA